MSSNLYKESAALRFWNEEEIRLRESIISSLYSIVKNSLLDVNHAWRFYRMEGPVLTPQAHVSESYTDKDIFLTNHEAAGQKLVLRAETTASSYLYAKELMSRGKRYRPPICVWQMGKSFRRELSDGASPSKLRFNEFHQLEFQCIYDKSTLVDYRSKIINKILKKCSYLVGQNCEIEESDRLPSYSESTLDIVTDTGMEIASISIRNDFDDKNKVLEIAFGLDRMVDIYSNNQNL